VDRAWADEDRQVSLAGKVLVDRIDAELLEVQKLDQVVGFGVALTMGGRFTAGTNAPPPPICSTARTSLG
jgi:hypothetical protein